MVRGDWADGVIVGRISEQQSCRLGVLKMAIFHSKVSFLASGIEIQLSVWRQAAFVPGEDGFTGPKSVEQTNKSSIVASFPASFCSPTGEIQN